MMNFLVELSALFDPDSVKSNNPDACSDVFVNNNESVSICIFFVKFGAMQCICYIKSFFLCIL